MMASASVDLPQPDSPTRPRHSPGFTSRLTPSTAFSVLMPPLSALPTVKWTARSSSSSSVSGSLSPWWWHRTRPSAASGVTSGAVERQTSVTDGQRGLKRQPEG